MHEVKRLKEEVIKLKGKEQVRPSQDNRDSVVKKLEKGSDIASSTFQQDHKSIKHKIPRKKSLGHIKCYRCLEKGHYAKIVKSNPMRKRDFQKVKESFQKTDCALVARKRGIWFNAILSSSGLTRPVTPDRSDRSRPVVLQDPSRSPQSSLSHSITN